MVRGGDCSRLDGSRLETVRARMVFESVTAAGVGRLTSRFALVGKGDRGIPKGGRASE